MAAVGAGRIRFVWRDAVFAEGEEVLEGAVVLTAETGLVAEDESELAGFGEGQGCFGGRVVVGGEGSIPGGGFGAQRLMLTRLRDRHSLDGEKFGRGDWT